MVDPLHLGEGFVQEDHLPQEVETTPGWIRKASEVHACLGGLLVG